VDTDKVLFYLAVIASQVAMFTFMALTILNIW